MRGNLNHHQYFEELCALEMVDQLSQRERLELLTHCSSCPDCEAWLSDAHVVSSHLLISHEFSVKSEALPIGVDTRFVAEAHRRGISLLHSQGQIYLSRMKLAAVAVILVGVGMPMGFSIHQATHSVTRNAAARSLARPEDLLERPTPSPSSAVTNPLNRAPLPRRTIPRRATREARPTPIPQDSPLAAWSQQPSRFQVRSVLFDFSDYCHFVPQKPGLLQSPEVQVPRTLPRLGVVSPLAASPERAFRYEATLLPIGANISPTQSHRVAFPSPQFPRFYLNLEHTR